MLLRLSYETSLLARLFAFLCVSVAVVCSTPSQTGTRPTHVVVPLLQTSLLNVCKRCFGRSGVVVDSVDYFAARAQRLRQRVERLRRHPLRRTTTAFVTFKSLSSAAQGRHLCVHLCVHLQSRRLCVQPPLRDCAFACALWFALWFPRVCFYCRV